MRLGRALGALVALAALLVGVPWLLLTIGNPADLLLVDWSTALWVSVGSRTVLALLSVAGWLAWALLALTVVVEVVAVVSRQRVVIRVPGTGWLRPAVAALVVAAFAGTTTQVALADGGASRPANPDPVATSAASERDAETPLGSREYVVQPGDELWTIAHNELGEGARWRDLLPINQGLSESSRLTPGQIIHIPVEAPAPDSVTVQPGDSLWLIADRELGDPHRWPEVHDENRAVIEDPDHIEVGWELHLPQQPTATIESVIPEPATQLPPVLEVVEPAPDPVAPTPAGEPTPAEATPTSAGVGARGVPDLASEAEDEDEDGATIPLGAIGTILAGAIVTSLIARRRAQILGRAISRRLIPVSAQVGRFWSSLAKDAEEPAGDTAETALVLGWDAEGQEVIHDLEAARCTFLTGASSHDAMAAAITSLACAPWSERVHVLLAGAPAWAEALDDPRIQGLTSTYGGLQRLTRVCSERRLAMRGRKLAELRTDADAADAWAPIVVVFAEALTPAQTDALSDALALGEVGVSVLALVGTEPHISAVSVAVEAERAVINGRAFTPQLVEQPAKRALLELFATTGTQETEAAPWWHHGDLPPNVQSLHRGDDEPVEDIPMKPTREHPTLLLLGEVELVSARGEPPNRALGQCMEYCAWLLAHPGGRPTTMLRDLTIADATRRSNLSRLRSWLGVAEDDEPYLPDAYSGRLVLDPRVSSDWEEFEALLSGGVNLVPTATLRRALAMVRGEPLGTYGFQWLWAEQMRADMVAMIVDAAVVLADRSIAQNDPQTALWAVERGRLASAGDDSLAAVEIHALALAGRSADAERAVVALNRATRAGGRDLPPDLARRVQAALRLAQVG